ncbi:MAG: hypothetical protein HND48_13370 [Chloroflexi bacterium]|nr:hypothetical protein [Chloroflexota bacterium]
MEATMKVEVVSAPAALLRDHIGELVDLLRDSVNGGASVNFVPPLDERINRHFWERVCGEVERGERKSWSTG